MKMFLTAIALLTLGTALHAASHIVLYREAFADAQLKPTTRGVREVIAPPADANDS